MKQESGNNLKGPTLVALGILCLAGIGLASARDALTIRQTNLRAEPDTAAGVLATLQAGQRLSIKKRQGGWYQVESGEQQGWIRLLEVRFPTEATQNTQSGVGDLLSMRQGHSNITATTGVRGIGDADIKNAKPNFAALVAASQYQVTAQQAQNFAAQGQLKARQIKFSEVSQ